MATHREDNLRMPVLWEIATFLDGKIEFKNRRDYFGDLALVVDRLADLYHLSESQRNECYPESGKRIFESEVRYTMDILEEEEGALTNDPYVSWKITAKGMECLKAFIARRLRNLSASDLEEFLASQDENGQDLFVNSLTCHSAESLSALARNASSYRDLFISAVEQLPLDKLGPFLTSAHYKRELLLADHVGNHRGSAMEPYESIEAACRLLRRDKK